MAGAYDLSSANVVKSTALESVFQVPFKSCHFGCSTSFCSSVKGRDNSHLESHEGVVKMK